MADRSAEKIVSLAASGSDVYTSPAIPNGMRLVIRKFGCADDGVANGKACTFRLQFGTAPAWKDIRVIATNANTVELAVNKEIIGDGTSVIRVTTTNSSAAAARTAAWWLEGYDKD